MATLRASTLISNSKPKRGVKAVPRRVGSIPIQGLRIMGPNPNPNPIKISNVITNPKDPDSIVVMRKLYAIMEAVADRVEMHRNVGEQRDNWNSLMLTSINSITLAAAAMAGIAAIGGGGPGLRISSTALYVAATGMLAVMNKIQPSQLAEEQRNAARLFKQLQNQIQTVVAVGNPTEAEVREMMERVLALDKAFPLPLIGAMIDKFPAAVEPAMTWTEGERRRRNGNGGGGGCNYNGWNGRLEEEMRRVARVVKVKDKSEYLKMGEKALKLNRFLAIAGPVLTGIAAVGTAVGGEWTAAAGVVGGALASVVNTMEHGGQVGMVFEMYRSNAGFFEMIEKSIESNLKEAECERRENGQVFQIKVAMQLGRSLSELRDLGAAAEDIHEFASKIF